MQTESTLKIVTLPAGITTAQRTKRSAASSWREAARWGGLPGCPYRNGSILDEIYKRAAERQHGPDGIMTKIKARWAELNQPKEVTA